MAVLPCSVVDASDMADRVVHMLAPNVCKVGHVAALVRAAQKRPSIDLINAFLTSYLTDIYSPLSPFILDIHFSMTRPEYTACMQVLVFILGVTRHVMPKRPHGPRVDFSLRVIDLTNEDSSNDEEEL